MHSPYWGILLKAACHSCSKEEPAFSCICQTTSVSFPDTEFLLKGFRNLRSHLVWPEFGEKDRHIFASRAGVLAAHLRAGKPFDLVASRYTGSESQLAALREASLNRRPHSWIDGIKSTNAEAYHYWYLALTLS